MWWASHLILHQECLGILLHKFKNQLVAFYEKFYWDLFGSALTFCISGTVVSLIIKEMQIKTTMRYHLIPVRMVITKKTTNTKSCQECGGKGNPYTLLWECKLVQPLWKTVWGFLKKLKMELPYGPVSPLVGPKKMKTLI